MVMCDGVPRPPRLHHFTSSLADISSTSFCFHSISSLSFMVLIKQVQEYKIDEIVVRISLKKYIAKLVKKLFSTPFFSLTWSLVL